MGRIVFFCVLSMFSGPLRVNLKNLNSTCHYVLKNIFVAEPTLSNLINTFFFLIGHNISILIFFFTSYVCIMTIVAFLVPALSIHVIDIISMVNGNISYRVHDITMALLL